MQTIYDINMNRILNAQIITKFAATTRWLYIWKKIMLDIVKSCALSRMFFFAVSGLPNQSPISNSNVTPFGGFAETRSSKKLQQLYGVCIFLVTISSFRLWAFWITPKLYAFVSPTPAKKSLSGMCVLETAQSEGAWSLSVLQTPSTLGSVSLRAGPLWSLT